MKADERIIEARARLEAVETLLKDQRIGPDLKDEIRGHFHVSQSSTSIDQASLFRCDTSVRPGYKSESFLRLKSQILLKCLFFAVLCPTV